MKNEDIELVVLSRVATNLGISITRAQESLKGGFYTKAVIEELLKEHKKQNKIATDCYKTALKVPRAAPIMVEYSRARKYVTVIEELIDKANKSLIKMGRRN